MQNMPFPFFPKARLKPSLLLELLLSLKKQNRKKAYKLYFQNHNISKNTVSNNYLSENPHKPTLLNYLTQRKLIISDTEQLRLGEPFV